MGAYLGDTGIGQMFLGSIEIGKAYLGDTKVWEKGGVTPPQPLPYDAEIEYLQSSGTQYIDTGVYGYMNHTYELSFQQITTARMVTWGARGQQSYIGYNMTFTWADDGATKWCVRWESTETRQRYVVLDVLDTNKHTINCSKGRVYFDDSYKGTSAGNNDDFILEHNVYLFCSNNAGVANPTSLVKIYSYKDIDENGNLVRDFIPVRVGQVGYMYDKVSGQLFGNAGTGNFVLGNDITT